MKTLITLLFSVVLYSNTVPSGLIGKFQSSDDEFVVIEGDGYFCRLDHNGLLLAEGNLKATEGGILVERTDMNKEYILTYFVGDTNIVIGKPDPKGAWLLQRIGY